MPRRAHVYAALLMLVIPTNVIANDAETACQNFARAAVIFVGRVKSPPITRRISGEEEIEKARIVMEAAEREMKAFAAMKMPPEIGEGRIRDLAVRAVKAREHYNEVRAMYPPPSDLLLTPIVVEAPLLGVTTTDVFLHGPGPELEPGRSYLFYAQRSLPRVAPDVVAPAARPKEVEAAEEDLRFLRDAIANNTGTVVRGSLTMPDANNPYGRLPLGGIALRISVDDQRIDASTGADGTFVLTGVPAGTLRIEPVLPEHLTMTPFTRHVQRGCVDVHMAAAFDGRIRGRVFLDGGAPFRGFVDLVPADPGRREPHSSALTNERGEFSFSAVVPGDYLVGINILRQPQKGAPFRTTYFPGTTERAAATPVTVRLGTGPADLEWVLSARLPEGSIEVSLDTQGQPQKNMGVCVTMFDNDNRSNGGVGYDRTEDQPVLVSVVEGVRYRLIAHAQTPSGFVESEALDLIGAPERQTITLPVGFTTQTAPGIPCSPASTNKPFSLPR